MKCVYTHAYMCLSLPGEGTVDHYCVQFWFFGMCVRDRPSCAFTEETPVCNSRRAAEVNISHLIQNKMFWDQKYLLLWSFLNLGNIGMNLLIEVS